MALVGSEAIAASHGMRVAFERVGGYIINAEPMRADPESIVQIKGTWFKLDSRENPYLETSTVQLAQSATKQ